MNSSLASATPRGSFEERALRLHDALGLGLDVIPDTVQETASATLSRVMERRQLSAEHTVIGFFGATGSGKSTLFNTIAGMPLARTAVTRPTTSEIQAAIWGRDGSEELLDWLKIENRVYPEENESIRQIRTQTQNSAADFAAPHEIVEPVPGMWNKLKTAVGRGQTRTRSGGLILLDLPDLDSVAHHHREQVERMLSYVDVLVWVLDPQKYADAAVHHDFLAPLSARGHRMVCVLNQADTLDSHEVPQVLDALTELLEADGITPLLITAPFALSAHTGEGVSALRSLLGRVAAEKNAAYERTEAQLYAIRRDLADYQGGEAPLHEPDYAVDELTEGCFQACGAVEVLDAAEASYRRRAVANTGWIATRWVAKFRADPLKRLHLGNDTAGTHSASESAPQKSPMHLTASSLPPLTPAQQAALAQAARGYGESVAQNIEAPWKQRIQNAALTREQDFPEAFERAIARVDYNTTQSRFWWKLLNTVQWIAFLSLLGGVAWLTAMAFASYLQIPLPPAPVPEGSPVPVPTLLLILGVLLGILGAVLGRALVNVSARAYRRSLRMRMIQQCENAAQQVIVAPVLAEYEKLRRYRQALT